MTNMADPYDYFSIVVNRKNSSIDKATGVITTRLNEVNIDADTQITLDSIRIPFSWQNISAILRNNTVSYRWNGVNYPVVFPNTSATIGELSQYLNYVQGLNGHYLTDTTTNKPVYFISMVVNTFSYSVTLNYTTIPTVIAGYAQPVGFPPVVLSGLCPQLVFDNNDFNLITGAVKNTTYPTVNTASGSLNFPNTPDVRTISNISVECNLVYNPYQTNRSLFSFLAGTVVYGDYQTETRPYPLFLACIPGKYANIVCSLIDQSNRPVNILDDDLQLNLTLRVLRK